MIDFRHFKKLLLLSLVVITFLVVGGCNPVVVIPGNPTPPPGGGVTQPPTNTVASTIYISSYDGVHGSVYIDGAYMGVLTVYGTLSVYNISYGTHTLTLDTLPYTTYTINVTYDGQTINIDWNGNAW